MERGTISRAKQRLVTQLDPGKDDDPCVVLLRVHLATEDLRYVLLERLWDRREKARLAAALTRLIAPHPQDRDREGELQPQVPRLLRDQLRDEARKLGARKVNELIREKLGSWIDFGVGRRKKNKKGIRMRPGRAFRERGRELARMKDRVRYTFNAGSGSAADAVLQLVKASDMNLSEFFSAVFDSLCAREPEQT